MKMNIMYLLTLLMALNTATLANDTTLDDAIANGLRETITTTSLNHLSRKRRYLQFPEGSSFQLVYDLVMGVVDYANYITLSITMALAYELPSKLPDELLEDVRDSLRDGSFGFKRNDTISNITYVDADSELKRHKAQPKIPRYPQKTTFNAYYTPQAANRNYNFTPNFNPFQQYLLNPEHLRFASGAGKYPWSSSGLRTINPTMRNSGPIKFPSLSRNVPSNHRIYPILGKRIGFNGGTRSGIANGIPSKYDRIHIRHQRSTRHDLYNAIETYLNRKNMNGHHCVLRVLCETGRKMGEQVPGSFVGELMRAIFTMPEPLEDNIRPGYKEEHYDKAAHTRKADCADHYHQCGHSLWSSNFVV